VQEETARSQLLAAVSADPGHEGFASLGEHERRAGRLGEAEAVLRAGLAARPEDWRGRVALALTLLDLGREVEARENLEPLAGHDLERFELAGAVSDDEIEHAFEAAETDREELIDPDRVAAEAVAWNAPEPEPLDTPLEATEGLFVTATMADVLEQQGDRQGADRIRASLVAGADGVEDEPSHTVSVVSELTRWLRNAQNRMGDRA
jgi:hypothetical protein